MQTIFRLCVLAYIVLVEHVSRKIHVRNSLIWGICGFFSSSFIFNNMAEFQTSAFDYRIHTPIGMFKYGKQIGSGSYGKVRRGNIVSTFITFSILVGNGNVYVSFVIGVFMKTQMSVAIKIEIDDPEKHDKDRLSLAIEKDCYDDMGVQRKCNIFTFVHSMSDDNSN